MNTRSRSHKVQISDEDLASMYHKKGMSLSQIGRELGINAETVRYHMTRRGIPRRPPSTYPSFVDQQSKHGMTERNKKIQDHLDLNRSQIVAWCSEGATLEKMGTGLGVSYGTVRNYCIREGIQYTTKRGWRLGTNTGEKHHSWKGGRTVSADGYVSVTAPEHPNAKKGGKIREHRLVMSTKIGRPLRDGEVVHHKDGNKQNNHPDNLELFASNSEHMSREHAGRKMTEEQKAKLSAVRKGRPGKPHSPEHKEYMRSVMTGRTFTPETIEKIRSAALRRGPRQMTDEKRAQLSDRLRQAHARNPAWGEKSGLAMRAGRQALTCKNLDASRMADESSMESEQFIDRNSNWLQIPLFTGSPEAYA